MQYPTNEDVITLIDIGSINKKIVFNSASNPGEFTARLIYEGRKSFKQYFNRDVKRIYCRHSLMDELGLDKISYNTFITHGHLFGTTIHYMPIIQYISLRRYFLHYNKLPDNCVDFLIFTDDNQVLFGAY